LIRAIFACDENWGIGKDNTLPWPHNPADLKWFKECTLGGVVVMGRHTWDSLPNKPLPNRNNIVITSEVNPTYGPYHFVKYDSYKSTVKQMSLLQPVWIIGGARLLENSLDIVDEIWISRIQGIYDCDTYLPRDVIELCYDLISCRTQDDGLHIEKWSKI
jgi:dihydrofolate reductase